MNAKEAAELLGIRPDTLAQWRKRRKGPPSMQVDGRTFVYPFFPLVHFGLQRLALARQTPTKEIQP